MVERRRRRVKFYARRNHTLVVVLLQILIRSSLSLSLLRLAFQTTSSKSVVIVLDGRNQSKSETGDVAHERQTASDGKERPPKGQNSQHASVTRV